jgi:hypothetical protein
MSLNVLVVPENPTYNGAILKPLCEKLFVECGRAQAKIEVLANPRTNGYEHAKSLFPATILDLYSHKHLVLSCPIPMARTGPPNSPRWNQSSRNGQPLPGSPSD